MTVLKSKSEYKDCNKSVHNRRHSFVHYAKSNKRKPTIENDDSIIRDATSKSMWKYYRTRKIVKVNLLRHYYRQECATWERNQCGPRFLLKTSEQTKVMVCSLENSKVPKGNINLGKIKLYTRCFVWNKYAIAVWKLQKIEAKTDKYKNIHVQK